MSEKCSHTFKPIVTATSDGNSLTLANILNLYVTKGSVIADVTYGKGVFWRDIDESDYDLRPTDLASGVDFCDLPYMDSELDALVLDPPYMHGGKTVKKSINDCYKNQNTSHESVIRLYAGGILEASRCLKKGGIIIIKSQDEIESGKQRFSHLEIMHCLEMFGFSILDLFVVVQKSIPAMREKYQKTARKNHSYFIVGRFRR